MIRCLEEKDRENIVHLLRATESFNEAEISIAMELAGIILGQPAQTDYLGFVHEAVECGMSRITGLLIVGPTPATTGTWHLYWIAVDPEYYGTGVAQTLHSWAEALICGRGGYWLLAETSSQPGYARARAFYRQQQYAELARIPDYYKPADDMILYGKRLPLPIGEQGQ